MMITWIQKILGQDPLSSTPLSLELGVHTCVYQLVHVYSSLYLMYTGIINILLLCSMDQTVMMTVVVTVLMNGKNHKFLVTFLCQWLL